MADDKLTIKVKIIDRFYPIRINRDEEELIRKASDKINETVSQYRSAYSDKDNDNQDFLSMVCINYVTKFLKNEGEFDASGIVEDLKLIETKLSVITEKE